MAVDVLVPAVGESVKEGMIHKWHKNSGDYVKMDEVIVELETDKATVEVVAQTAGALQILKKQGETVLVGSVIAKIDTAATAPAGQPAVVVAAPVPSAKTAPVDAVASSKVMPLSPSVQRMVAEHNLNPQNIPASGKDGRITKGDVVAFVENPSATTTTQARGNLAAVPQPQTVSEQAGTRREPMSMLRRRIAERLVHAQHTAAILTTFNEIDMSQVMELRAKYKDTFKEKHGVSLGFMGFFVRACVEALQAFPAINGYVDGTDIVYNEHCHIGVAVSSPRGLVVPVVRNCDQMNIAAVENVIGKYGAKARDGKISVDDLSGGTFTVSNGGVFGSLLSTPILNPPQSGILGMHKIEQRAMVIGGQIVARPMMYVALSYDHRIVDGKEAVGFLVKVKECIEDPTRLLLGV